MQKFVKPHFFEDHSGKKARVPVYSTTAGIFGSKFKMICFSIPRIAVDFDGAPGAYAPPVSATNHHPRNGLHAKDDIRDGTTESAAVFHADGKGNTFHWIGVLTGASPARRKATRTLISGHSCETRKGTLR